ncbi:PREDICTED: myeloid leukemia factor isoform X2 [Dufourea novaeangliae]|uniref:myeloid leukemia factor isoform X2 n=1 Tax=Dufourea novaeangliae TaxID=178035 RepID=UPI00076776EC|nr:PREDICTED: myeloid leukemia factor isoform X2 [Dufourea novaeangliae]
MSLFGSFLGDDDPFFGSQMRSMRQMNDMMNSLFSDPFGIMGQNAITNGSHNVRNHHNDLQIMPFGFPPMPTFNMGGIFTDFDNMAPNAGCHSFTSRSVMTMASGPDGHPQVYQETMSTTTAPGGVKETKKTVSDSRTGVKKLAIGHHIGERAHIMEREHNLRSGEQEERQEFINLDEEEAETFNNEWESHTRHGVGAIGNSHYGGHGHRNRSDHRQLALPGPSGRWTPSPRRGIKSPPTSKTHTSPHALSSDTSSRSKPATAKSTTATSTSTANVTPNRKREHTPDVKVCNKRHAVSDSNI